MESFSLLENPMEYLIVIYILLYNYILFSVNSSAINDDVKAPQYCQGDPTAIGNHAICLEKCSKRKGFVHSGQGQFLCSNEHEKPGSPKLSKSNTVDGLYDCECEHPRKGFICDPPILHVDVTKDRCDEICKNYYVLIYNQNGKLLEAYCEEASSIKLFDLEAITLNVLKTKMKNDTRVSYWSKICKCGINLDSVIEEKKNIQIEKKKPKRNLKKNERKYLPSDELDHILCTVGELLLQNRDQCERKCASARAFLGSNNELICYHERRKGADVISSGNEECRCGAIINKNHRDTEYKLPCNPVQPVEKIPASECGIVCNNLSVYIFKGKEIRIVTYCDSKMDPPEGFDGLEPQFKRYRRPSPSKRHELPCSCGVNTSPPSKKQTTNENSSTFEATRSKINTRDLDSGETEFHVATDQRNLRNLYGNGSSSQPVTNPIITTNANKYASTFLTATDFEVKKNMRNSNILDTAFHVAIDQSDIQDSYGRMISSQPVTNPVITPNSRRNASNFLTATNRVSSWDFIPRDSPFGCITNQDITPNFNNHAGSFIETNQEIYKERGIRNLHGSSSTRDVTNLINFSNLNQDNSVFSIAKQQVPERKNFFGSDSSSGVSASQGSTPHSNICGSLQTSAPQILSGQPSIQSVGSSHSVPHLEITQNLNAYYATSYDAIQNLGNAQEPNLCVSSSEAIPSSSEAFPNRRVAQNPNMYVGSSKYASNKYNKQIAEDSVVKIPSYSFVNLLLSDTPDNSLEDIPPFDDIMIPPFDDIIIPPFDDSIIPPIDDIIIPPFDDIIIPPFDDIIVESINQPVEDCNVPSQFGQLPQSPFSKNTSTFDNESSSFLRDDSNALKGICLHDSTNKNANHEDDIFGQKLTDDSINCPPSIVIQPREVAVSNLVPVDDLNYPLQFDDLANN